MNQVAQDTQPTQLTQDTQLDNITKYRTIYAIYEICYSDFL